MIWGAELIDHLWGLLILCTAACVPGACLARLLPGSLLRRESLASWPVLGGACWAAMLYVLAFRGGLIVAGIIALAVLIVPAVVRYRARRLDVDAPFEQTMPPSGGPARQAARAILVIGCLSYITPVLAKHVPDGMDASRYLICARLIGATCGLPDSLSPFMPEVPFGAMNHGVPALAGVAVMCGASPAAAVLAAIPFTFASLILSLYLFVRLVLPRIPAAIVAVSVVWFSHQAQRTISWGGFPGIFALAVGVLAARLLVDVLRGRGRFGFVPLGVCVGPLPMLHGCMAAGWLHIVLPVALVVGLWVSRRRGQGLASAALAAVLAGGIVAAYLLVGRPHIDGDTAEWIRTNEMANTYPGHGRELLLTAPAYLRKTMGVMLTWVVLASAVVLVARRRWRGLAVAGAGFVIIALVLVNAKYAALPTTLLLYPTRIREFSLMVAALTIALAWRRLPRTVLDHPKGPAIAAAVVLALAVSQHHRYYQRTACRRVISEEAWQMLQWSAHNLDPRRDLVANIYATAGAYLPGVAGVAATNWHAHFDQKAAAQAMLLSRHITHALFIERDAILSRIGQEHFNRDGGELLRFIHERSAGVVFSRGVVTLYMLRRPGSPPAPKHQTPRLKTRRLSSIGRAVRSAGRFDPPIRVERHSSTMLGQDSPPDLC